MSRTTRIAVALALLAAAVCLADGPVVRNDWVSWDDHATLYDNPDFNPPTFAKLLECWREPRGHLYIPVTYSYWWALAEVAWRPDGLRPAVFHAASVVLHIVAAWLVFAIAVRLTKSVPAACCGALLFAVHPVQVESVAWASGAKDLLAGVLSLAAIWLFMMRREGTTPRRRALWISVATIAYALALLSKPSAAVVPLVVLAVDWLANGRLTRDVLYTAAGWLALALPVVLLTRHIQPAVGVVVPPLWQRPLVALDALGFYVRTLVWPANLAFVYGRTPDVQLASPWISLALASAAILAIGFAARRWPVVAATAAIFVAALLPYLGLVPFDFQAYSSVSDHYLYLAMLGPALLVAYLMVGRSGIWWIGCAVVLVLLAIVSYEQTAVWRGKMTLLRHAIAMNPQRSGPHYALAVQLARRNDLEGAEREYRLALEYSPHDLESRTNLAHLLTQLGRDAEAVEHYQLALAGAPGDPLKKNNVAIALAAVGQVDGAIAMLREALESEDTSQDDVLHGNLGRLLMAKGQDAEARAELEQALAIDPDLEVARRGLELLDAAPESNPPANDAP